VDDLGSDRPELFIALHLNNDAQSPWYRQLDLGGSSTSGLARRASLRTMQKAIRVFFSRTKILKTRSVEAAAQTVLDFWAALSIVLQHQWSHPRKHMLTKGVGVYALLEIAADLYSEGPDGGRGCDRRYFANALSDFAGEVDWSTEGSLKGFGGQGGVKSAVELIREIRKKSKFRVIVNG
jgi:DNA sulfur modification protein DndB